MEDFNVPSAERAIGDVPPYFWAACQVCHVEALKKLVKVASISPAIVRVFAARSRTMKQKTLHSPGSDASSPPLSRNRLARDLADERDNFRCVLSGDSSRESAWDHLKNLWPEQKIADWELELFQKGRHEMGEEKTYLNLITLSRTAHDMWARGAFALKPISVSNDNMTLKHLDQNDGAFDSARALLYYADKRITSGQFFELRTNDTTAKTLPSFQLLKMQWFLQRVAGMAGAAGDIDWEDLDEDS
ncbi:hypothetical protein POJ06DRAFT_293493 [Lipomyces tetrasporus]|uniref:HNH nuclease domain-containing protein n=1 Tax=Lipomyces tetrasporus TaxID=54092 RepID=A0AAD7VWL1_9ASCO|nr:uncharacterized protein POJ06DRAFT_293493 [Lipomyces tetrasporus]KAJ8103630.1 hypothetical protein POJ06DRAFT_293493 [Lipomyces tetrasporus]